MSGFWRLAGATVALVMTLCLSLPFSGPAQAVIPTSWSVTMTPASTTTTVQITVSFAGLKETSAIELKLLPTDNVLASGFSSADGQASFTFGLPGSLRAGSYTITASGTTDSSSAFLVDVATFAVATTGIISDTSLRDGPLTLSVAVDASASFGTPYLVNNISYTDGALGRFYVRDDRTVSRPGWTLYATVGNFALSSDNSVVLPSNQLGIAPLRFSPESSAEGVTLGTPTIAGAATYPMVFAQAEPGASPGVTAFDANLRLISPPYLPVGTYNSTLTLTLVSR